MSWKLPLLCLFLTLTACSPQEPVDLAYQAEVDTWHAARIERLQSDTGWLTLVGLHPLRDGVNVLGSGSGATVRMTEAAPDRLGELTVDESGVAFTAAPDVEVFAIGEEATGRITHRALATDRDGAPTTLTTGSLIFFVIDRDGDLYLRVKDRLSEVLKHFTGIDRFAVHQRWRVTARIEGVPGSIVVPNVLGGKSASATPGTLVFELDGQTCRLTPTGDPTLGLFIIFADQTTGQATYGAGRFLTTEPVAADGTVALDFNRAYNPPCVFTAYATCPLPPQGNRLPLAVEAGEKTWGQEH